MTRAIDRLFMAAVAVSLLLPGVSAAIFVWIMLEAVE